MTGTQFFLLCLAAVVVIGLTAFLVIDRVLPHRNAKVHEVVSETPAVDDADESEVGLHVVTTVVMSAAEINNRHVGPKGYYGPGVTFILYSDGSVRWEYEDD